MRRTLRLRPIRLRRRAVRRVRRPRLVRRRLLRFGPAVVLAAVALVALPGCGAVRDRQDASDATGSTAPAGTTPAGPAGTEVGASTDGTSSTTTASGATPTPWSDNPPVEPIGQTIDGTTATPDGRTRTWHLYVPTTLPTDRPVPLLVGLHGGTGWGEQFQRSSGFDGIAEANGFLVVFPDGIGVGPTETMRTWNGGVCCGPAAKDDVDDVGFISLLIDQISADHDVDPSRVYAAGHSNGAVLSIRIACELADKVVAVGFQAGTMEIDSCQPAAPVSMLHLHGVQDENMPPQGGKGTKGISGVTWNPAIDGLRTLAAADGCPDPVTVTDVRRDTTVERWSPCAAGTEIEYVLVDGATHAWMGARMPGATEPGTTDFDSSAAIWTFLAAHPRR